MRELVRLDEPRLLFGHGQAMEDPRDGMTLFGPLDAGKPYGIMAGVIGTKDGIRRFSSWVNTLQNPITDNPRQFARPSFPGFDTAFRIPWNPQPSLEIVVPELELSRVVHLDDRHQRVFKTVEIYSRRIIDAIKQEDSRVDIWFVIIPDEVYQYCRPQSFVEPALAIKADNRMSPKKARDLAIQPSLMFPEDNQTAVFYSYEAHFHNQLKARLLNYAVATQVVRESTVAYREFVRHNGKPKRDLAAMQSAIAWNIATAAFYKAGGRPWKLASIRQGVCYIGLVFKRDLTSRDPRSACCAAQMFLDSGDGMVFKGAVGPWYSTRRGDFHLSRASAKELVSLAMKAYSDKHHGPPRELFLHGKVRFSDEEWKGFHDAVDSSTNLVGVRIRQDSDFKLYKKTDHTVLRGLASVRDDRNAYLWTKGFIPRLQTYPGREVPLPLFIEVCRGEADIRTVLNDIMALTKLNYNACVFADGLPVTLRFADVVGEILTAAPLASLPPLPFKYYI